MPVLFEGKIKNLPWSESGRSITIWLYSFIIRVLTGFSIENVSTGYGKKGVLLEFILAAEPPK
jgi:hypothetical protein